MFRGKTIDCYVDGRDNNYSLIRFIAASLVIFSHSYHLTGYFNAEPLLRLWGFIDFSAVAVAIFFVVSGFLIAQSFNRRRNLWVFFEARVLRIFPALIIAVFLTVFIVGAWATSLSRLAYFKNPETLSYFINNILLDTRFTLPGVFTNNSYPNAVNGSLWTLRGEFYMYLLVAAFGVLGMLKFKWLFNTVVVMGFITFWWNPHALFIIPDTWTLQFIKLFASFVLGAIAYINRAHIPLNFWLGTGLIVLTLVGRGSPWFMHIFYISLAYWTLLFAYHPLLRINWFNRLGDYSYGLYIFAFPIQQSLVHVLDKPTPLLVFSLAFPLTLMLAILSWHFIEKPSLSFKGKWPWSNRLAKP